MDAFETLRRLMPPTAASDTAVDWSWMIDRWGKEFPDDYRQFVDVYGAGSIDNYLSILAPEAAGDEPSDNGMLSETATAQTIWMRGRKSNEIADLNPELIAWGVDASADLLCWDASGDDPGRWPVLVFNRDDALWSRYDCGMAEFLLRLLRADFVNCPLGAIGLWGVRTVRFLNNREYLRLLNQGFDPWTGEPDPYAGMFDDLA